MKYMWEQNNLLYLSNGKLTRVIPLKTWNALDTTNPTITKKVLENGTKLSSPKWEVQQPKILKKGGIK